MEDRAFRALMRRRAFRALMRSGGFGALMHPRGFRALLWAGAAVLACGVLGCVDGPRTDGLPPSDPDRGGLRLPDGFEAVVVVDSLGPARHLTVNDNGDIYVKLRAADPRGSIVGLRDTDGDGRADVVERFGVFEGEGSRETGIEIHDGYLYFSTNLEVMRYRLRPGELIPDTTRVDTLVIDDHVHGYHGHQAKPISFDDEGNMYVPYGAPTNACQEADRTPGLPGLDPCPDLEQHGGIWVFDPDERRQVQAESRSVTDEVEPRGRRYATGIRSLVAMDWNPADGELYGVEHGQDAFFRLWPEHYTLWEEKVLPSEQLMRVTEGADFGWPYCYHDHFQDRKVLAPEYGGDGTAVGRCDGYEMPLIGFPGHFAPNDLQFYRGDQFPAYYRDGAFIAWHGSTRRDPYPQAGYFVAFVPFPEEGDPTDWDVFANGFTGHDPLIHQSDARHRPMGLAVGPDGSLYISDSVQGKIWRIMFKGDRDRFSERHRAGMAEEKRTASNVRMPHPEDDIIERADMDGLGARTYHVYCAACHSGDGEGAPPRYPPLVGTDWVTGDPEVLITIILDGMDGPIMVRGERYNTHMPAHDFLDDEEVAAVATYVREHFGPGASVVPVDEVREVRERLGGRE